MVRLGRYRCRLQSRRWRVEGVNVSEPARSLLSALRAELARLDLAISPRTDAAFADYLARVQEWNDRAGLTAIRNPEEIQRRLFGESLALLVVLRVASILRP